MTSPLASDLFLIGKFNMTDTPDVLSCVPLISAIVFDMDGLMFNTEDLYDQVGQAMLSKRGGEFTLELKLKMMGRKSAEAFAIMQQHCGITDSLEALEQENDAILATLLPQQIQKMPGLDQVLQIVKGLGVPVGLATSSRGSLTELKLNHFSLQHYFDHVVTGDEVTFGKPHPEIYHLVAKRMQVSPSAMLVFEDSVVGSTAAASAGAFTIAVPGRHGAKLDYSHAQRVVPRLDDPMVLNLLQKIGQDRRSWA